MEEESFKKNEMTNKDNLSVNSLFAQSDRENRKREIDAILKHKECLKDLYLDEILERMLQQNRSDQKFWWKFLIIPILKKSNNSKRKSTIIDYLMILEDVYFKKSLVVNLIFKKILETEDVKEFFSEQKELSFFSFENLSDSTEIVIENTRSLLNSLYSDENDIYFQLFSLFEIFLENDRIIFSQDGLKQFFKELLAVFQIPAESSLIERFNGFSLIEELLFIAMENYRDHTSHAFRVFCLGIQILSIICETMLIDFPKPELLCWTLISFLHDIGYGITKIDKITSRLQEYYQNFGEVIKPKFILSEFSRLFGEQVIDLMEKLLWTSEIQPRSEYSLLRVSPLIKSFDNRDHGIISAIIFQNDLDHIISADYGFYKRFENNWHEIFTRAALAMAIHTIPVSLGLGLNVDQKFGFNSVRYPIFYAFFLTVIDAVEYIDRPKFGGIHHPEVLDRDIRMSLQMELLFNAENYYHIRFKSNYLDDLDIHDTYFRLRERISCFHSEKWGVTVIFLDKDGSRLELPLLRIEEEKLLKFDPEFVQKVEERHTIYDEFWTNIIFPPGQILAEHLHQSIKQYNQLIPKGFSPQIKQLLEK